MNKTSNKTEALITLEREAMRTGKYIRCAELASAGECFASFIHHFSIYSETQKLTKNTNITNMLTVMLKAQERNDMLFVADILQYELLPYVKELVTSQD